MNNTATDDYCSFQVSKLLQDLGMDCYCHYYFFGDKTLPTWAMASMYSGARIMQPTHTLAIKWIRDNFGLHIHTYPTGVGYYCYEVFSIKKREDPKDKIVQTETTSIQWDELYDSSEEAAEAGLLYTLQKLIP